ncbi:MAG: nitrous oxide reductase family maturation protein NosD, partial [Candidatus Thorarchaeota archaeon]
NIVDNNNCTDNSIAILMEMSDSITLVNNTANINTSGISISMSSSITIINNTCNGNIDGIELFSSSFNIVTNNTCNGNTVGIWVDGAGSNTVNNNTCIGNSFGIHIQGSNANNVTDNTCTSSNLGIYIEGNSNTVANNTSTENGDGIRLYFADSNALINNTCSGNSANGISLDVAFSNIVANNTCISAIAGIRLTTSGSNTIVNNTCIGNSGYGIYLEDASSNILTNNTLSSNYRGIYLGSNADLNDVLWNVIASNPFSNAEDTNALNNVFDYNYWSDYSGTDTNGDGVGDTPYVFSINEDLHPVMLPPGSPPIWLEAPNDRLLEYRDDFHYDLNATARPPGLDSWWLNDTLNFDIDQNGTITNRTVLFLGVFGLQVFVNDSDGNTLSEVFSLTVIDTTHPEWMESPRNQTIEVGESFVLKLNATDYLLDTWWLNDTVHFAVDAEGVVSTAGIMPPGVYGIQVWVNDTSGNTLNGTFTVTVIDTTSPVWTEVPEDQIVEYGNDFVLDLNATDLLLDSWWVNDTMHFTVNRDGMMMATDILQVGTYGVQVWVNDTSNNIISTTFTVTVVDTKPPIWSEQPENQTLVYGTRFVCDFNATDLSGIAEWWVDDTVHFTIDWTGRVRTIGILEPGIYGLRVYVNDIYGNTIWAAILVEVIPIITTTTTTTSNSAIVLTEHLDPLMTFIIGMGVGTIVIVVTLWIGLRKRDGR